MLKRLLVVGSTGKIGHSVLQNINRNIYEVFGIHSMHSLLHAIETLYPDLIIDVTSAKCIHSHLEIYEKFQIPLLIGTSGTSPQESQRILSMPFPVLMVVNFAFKLTYFCQSMPLDKITHIYETHANSKFDKPSATALFLRAHYQSTAPISSVRIAQKVAHHTLCFAQHQPMSISITSYDDYIAGVSWALQHLQSISDPHIFLSPHIMFNH